MLVLLLAVTQSCVHYLLTVPPDALVSPGGLVAISSTAAACLQDDHTCSITCLLQYKRLSVPDCLVGTVPFDDTEDWFGGLERHEERHRNHGSEAEVLWQCG